MNKYSGQCQCGQTKVVISLTRSLDQYSPRLCDCHFCVARNISYLSDTEGELDIRTSASLEMQHQGSNQADFITCNNCQTVIAATYQIENKLIGALNSRLLSDFKQLQQATVVSPKKLRATDKVTRWEMLWMNLNVNNSITSET
ncbi:MAG: aldehyde-activating protein [Kangiellaceae bacterium]